MKAIKRCSKFLAVLLIVLTVVSILPMQTFATEYQNYKTLTTIDNETNEELFIKEEVVEERTANSKTYLLEDGTYCSLTTTAPVHTYEDGEWNDISTVSEQPETVEEAMSQLSSLQTTSSDANVDDGLILSDADKAVSIWGIQQVESNDDDNGVTISISEGSFTLGESSAGIVKVNTMNNRLYNKTEITIKADLRLSCSNTQNIENITIRPIYETWNIDTLSFDTINNSFSNPILDYNLIDSAGRYVWDITSEHIKWETGALENNGLLLAIGESSTTIYNGILRRQYRVIDDNDAGFTYHEVNMGRAGTLYVNDYTNVPYLVRDELALGGNLMPVSISRFINPGLENNSFGAGGRWNYESKLSKTADTYIWDMFNGSSSRFQKAIPIETDDKGREKWVEYQYNAQGYTLWVNPTKSRDYDYSDNQIVDESGNTYTFNYYGYVASVISGANENDILTIAYSGETLNSITDGIGRKYSFTHRTVNNQTAITKLSVFMTTTDDSGVVTETPITILTEDVDSEGNPISKPVEITFENQVINNKVSLTKATYADGKAVEYFYDNQGRLTGVKNIDGSLLELSYAISVDNIGQNVSPIYAYRLSGYTKKCLDENGQYVIDFSVSINADNAYHRVFEQKNCQNEIVFSENLQFNRNLDLLYMTNSAGESFYADYDESHNLLSLVIPERDTENLLLNGDMEKKSWGTAIPSNWSANTLYKSNFSTGNRTAANKYVLFDNSLERNLTLTQTISSNFNGNVGDKYVISAWGIGTATIPREEHFWGVRVFAANENGELIQIHQMAFDASLWGIEQTRATAFSLPFDTSSISIELISSGQDGAIGFDDVCLYKADYAYVAAVDDVETDSTCICSNCENSSCTCTCVSEETCTCVSCNIRDIAESDTHGNTTQESKTDGLTSLISQYAYTADSNYLSQHTDENNVSTSYVYSLTNGLKQSETFANDSSVLYGYDAVGALTSVSQTVTNFLTNTSIAMQTQYAYENDRIVSITHNGFSYNYDYDIYGNLNSISVSNTPLVSYSYNNDYYKTVNTITYANGMKISYSYDTKGNITGISYDDGDTWAFTYTYDEYGNLRSFTDNINHTVTSYDKTINGVKYKEVVETTDENSTIIYSLEETNNLSCTQSLFGQNYSVTNQTSYNSVEGTKTDVQTTSINLFGSDGFAETTNLEDAFGRRAEETIAFYTDVDATLGNPVKSVTVCNQYTYKNASAVRETRLVDTYISTITLETETMGEDGNLTHSTEVVKQINLKYDYDEAGRIARISQYFSEEGASGYYPIYYYSYDDAGQLAFEVNVFSGDIWSYTYDAGGNILSKSRYDSIEGNEETFELDFSTLGEPIETITYGYDSVWKDKLTSFDGVTIEYDALGNPLNYYGYSVSDVTVQMNLEWEGRMLSAATSKDGKNRYEYHYDHNGLRTGKTMYSKETYTTVMQDESGNDVTVSKEQFVKAATIEYIWSDGILVGYKTTAFDAVKDENNNYVFDEFGNIQTEANNIILVKPIYNKTNEIVGVSCCSDDSSNSSSETFYFAKDAQGNICSIYSLENDYYLDFAYDAFGRFDLQLGGAPVDQIQQAISNTSPEWAQIIVAILGGTALTSIVGITFTCAPNAYRGYIFDVETGLYYCQSRYYSPSWGRFINADDTAMLELTKGEILGANLFAYCNNDPINHVDPSGYYYISLKNLSKIFLVIGLNPIGFTLVAIGLSKLTLLLKAKYTMFIAKISIFWGTVVKWVFRAAALAVGLPLMGQLATAVLDCVLQGKGGIEFSVKKTRKGVPYGFSIYAR